MATAERLCGNCFSELTASGICPGCGFSMEQEAALRGSALPLNFLLKGKYVLGRMLGAGGFGITYLAYDQSRKQRFCIKEYFPAGMAAREPDGRVRVLGEETAYERGLNRFFREARTLQSLSGCPSVVRVDSLFQNNATAYLVMEYVEGENLKQYAERLGGKLSYDIACRLTISLALALSEIHSRGVFHRDINPKNVLINGEGQLKLIDFGSSQAIVANGEKSMSIQVTEGFAPPEQYSTKGEQGPWTDIYALAGTFYRLVSGVKVQPALERSHRDGVEALSTIFPGIDRSVSDTIQKAMRLDWRERYQTIDEFIEDFASDLDTGETSPVEISPVEIGQNPPVTLVTLTILSDTAKGITLPLPDGRTVRLGRKAEYCDLVVSRELQVSKLHCKLTFDKGRGAVLLEDVSTNGTYLENGLWLNKRGIELTRDATICLSKQGPRIRIQFNRAWRQGGKR